MGDMKNHTNDTGNIYDYLQDAMSCDLTGFCNGDRCPNYFACKLDEGRE